MTSAARCERPAQWLSAAPTLRSEAAAAQVSSSVCTAGCGTRVGQSQLASCIASTSAFLFFLVSAGALACWKRSNVNFCTLGRAGLTSVNPKPLCTEEMQQFFLCLAPWGGSALNMGDHLVARDSQGLVALPALRPLLGAVGWVARCGCGCCSLASPLLRAGQSRFRNDGCWPLMRTELQGWSEGPGERGGRWGSSWCQDSVCSLVPREEKSLALCQSWPLGLLMAAGITLRFNHRESSLLVSFLASYLCTSNRQNLLTRWGNQRGCSSQFFPRNQNPPVGLFNSGWPFLISSSFSARGSAMSVVWCQPC